MIFYHLVCGIRPSAYPLLAPDVVGPLYRGEGFLFLTCLQFFLLPEVFEYHVLLPFVSSKCLFSEDFSYGHFREVEWGLRVHRGCGSDSNFVVRDVVAVCGVVVI